MIETRDTDDLPIADIPGVRIDPGKFGFANPRETGGAYELIMRLRACTGSLEWTGSGFAEPRVSAPPSWPTLREVCASGGREGVEEAVRFTRRNWPEWSFVRNPDVGVLDQIDRYFEAARARRKGLSA